MSDFYLEIQDRSFEDINPDPGLIFDVSEAEWDQYGGPKKCKINISGPSLALWDLLEWLRYYIVVRTDKAERFWWGYVHAAIVKTTVGEIRMSLDEMYNRVKLSYAFMPTGSTEIGDQQDTDWASDAKSVAEYGTKELIASMDGATTVLAEARRDAILAARKYPQSEFSPRSHDLGGLADASKAAHLDTPAVIGVQLELRGWWQTLSWQYASEPPVTGIDYGLWASVGNMQMGRSSYGKHLQQFLVPAGGITVREITVCVSRVGSPVDNLVIEIYALDGSGNPTGSALASENVTGMDLAESGHPGGYSLVTAVLSAGVTLTGSTLYGLVLSRSGSTDSSNFYQVNLDEELNYTDGVHKVWFLFGTPAWKTNPQVSKTDGDMTFILWADDVVGAGRQMADMIFNSSEFITDTYFIDASDREQSNFLDGTKTLLDELVPVMAGAGANSRRMLGWVDWERTLRIYEEPASTTIAYFLNQKGQILDGKRLPVGLGDLYKVPGCYVELVDVIPESVDLTRLINPNIQFIESIKWTASGGVKPSFRGQMSMSDILNGKVDRY